MAAYFYGAPDVQTDGLQTLYLMNPGFFGYPEAPANMALLNTAASLPHNQTQHLVGVPLQPYIHGSQEISSIQNPAPPRLHHSLWTPTPSNNSMDMSSQLDLRRSPVASSTQQGSSISPASTGGAKLPALMGSKYLKAAQQLLDEVASVGKGDTAEKTMKDQLKPKPDAEHADETEMKAKLTAEITTAERQELQMKKAKLAAMLDEVEQRYRQYRNQMQTVVSSFEEVAGSTSARTYTSLALKTISKQFRCLRDSICSQIQATTTSLGENYKEGRGLRLRFLDHHQRQQRALQQLGMMQHSAWRPQRGLPEHAVSILRAWLFEHFLHPYPKDSDKQMLAKQTGLTRSQVSNWFINARVRLWKPMVEEMYLEESNEHEQNYSGERTRNGDAKDQPTSKSKSIASQDNSSSPGGSRQIHTQSSDNLLNHAGNSDDEAPVEPKAKKARSDDPLYLNMVPSHFIDSELKLNERDNQEVLMSFGDGRQSADEVNQGYHFITDSTDHGSSFGSYSIGGIGRFDHEQFTTRFSGNSVSLTLGLPHTESLSMSGAQPPYLSGESISLRGRMGLSNEEHGYCNMNNHPTAAHPSYPYESVKVKRGERFAAQLMPDFMSIG